MICCNICLLTFSCCIDVPGQDFTNILCVWMKSRVHVFRDIMLEGCGICEVALRNTNYCILTLFRCTDCADLLGEKCCCRGKHVISEHSDVLVLSHGALKPVNLVDTVLRHASPDHQCFTVYFSSNLLRTYARFAPRKS